MVKGRCRVTCSTCKSFRRNADEWWGLCLAYSETPDVDENMICRKFDPVVSGRLTVELDIEPVQPGGLAT